MAIKPRPQQVQALGAIGEARRLGRNRALVVMAAGLGKTLLTALDYVRFRRQQPGARLLYLCHQNDILEQAQLAFADVLGWKKSKRYAFFHGYEKQGAHTADVVFASFQTMRDWRTKFRKREFDYVVVDESHHTPAATYRPTVEYFEPKFLLGITATPDRMDLKDIRGIYGTEVYDLPLEEALARNLLTSVDYRLMTDEIHHLGILDTSVGRVSIKELNRVLFIPKRDEEIIEIIDRQIKGIQDPKVMIFCRSIKHCERIAQKIEGSIAIHSRLNPPEQRLRLRTFREGGAHTVLTVDKFNEGIDVPEANVIVFLRSTSSETIFLQQLGRGLRKVRGKHKVTVLDFVSNCERLEQVYVLWQRAHELSARRYGTKLKPAIEVDVERMQFSEVAVRIIDTLKAIRAGYRQEILIQQLRRLHEKFGRSPTMKDVRMQAKLGNCAVPETFRKIFGSHNEALVAAGLAKVKEGVVPRGGRTRQRMIDDLVSLSNELKRVPRKNDIHEGSKKGKCASVTAYRREFGSHNAALDVAGLVVTQRKTKLCQRTRSKKAVRKEEMTRKLQELSVSLKRTPTWREMEAASKEDKLPHPRSYVKVFGRFSAALKNAGLAPTRKRIETKNS